MILENKQQGVPHRGSAANSDDDSDDDHENKTAAPSDDDNDIETIGEEVAARAKELKRKQEKVAKSIKKMKEKKATDTSSSSSSDNDSEPVQKRVRPSLEESSPCQSNVSAAVASSPTPDVAGEGVADIAAATGVTRLEADYARLFKAGLVRSNWHDTMPQFCPYDAVDNAPVLTVALDRPRYEMHGIEQYTITGMIYTTS